MRRSALFVVLGIALAAPSLLAAQDWKPIGKTTRDGSEMFVRSSTIRRGGDTVRAMILTRFASPSWDPIGKDTLRALATMTTFNCRTEKVMVIESIYYVNFDRNRVARRSKPKTPGYQAVFGAAYPLAFEHLCGKKPK